MLAKILDLKTLSWQRRPLHCQKMEGKNGLQMLYFKKKEGRLGKHELKLYFTFTQKWSSTKYMLIFCNKWKLLHEKRVQSRKYFWGVYQHGRRVVLLLLFLFLFYVTAVVVNSRDILR